MPKPKKPVTKPRPVAAYVRVSSKGQKTDSQREEIRRWLEGNGIAPDKVEWYVDVESGRKMSRPEFDRLRRDIFAGRVKTVVVFKVDRIARRLRGAWTCSATGVNGACGSSPSPSRWTSRAPWAGWWRR